MKYKQALQPRTGVVGEWWNQQKSQVIEYCHTVCVWVREREWGIDMLGMKLGADGQSRLVLCRSCELWLLLAILPLIGTRTHIYTQTHKHTHGNSAESRFLQLDDGPIGEQIVDHPIINNQCVILICTYGRCSWLMRPNGEVLQRRTRAQSRIWGWARLDWKDMWKEEKVLLLETHYHFGMQLLKGSPFFTICISDNFFCFVDLGFPSSSLSDPLSGTP